MELLIILFVIGIFFYIVSNVANKPSKDLPATYVCKGCGENTPHNQRTQKAASNGSKVFFCKACHHKWLEKNNKVSHQGSGCMLVLFVPALVGIAGYIVY